jgi:threonine synthase
VPAYLQTGDYKPQQAIATLSNAMDVGDPSNFVRILEIFHKEFHSLKKVLTSYSISDEETKETIRSVYEKYNYLPDPHGAVGFRALSNYLAEQHAAAQRAAPPQKGIFLETAHPVKFYDTVEPITGQPIPLPPSVQAILGKQKQSKKIDAEYSQLKDFLLT